MPTRATSGVKPGAEGPPGWAVGTGEGPAGGGRGVRGAALAVVVIITDGGGRGGGGGWRGHPGPSLKPFSELIKRLGPRRSMATGRRLQAPSRPRAAHARGRPIDRGRPGSLAAPAPPLLPRCPATAARRAPIGRRRAGLPGGAWSVGQRGRGVARGPAAGAGRCRLPSDLSRRAEGAAGGKGAGEDAAARPPRKESLLTRFLSRGRTASRGGGEAGGEDPRPDISPRRPAPAGAGLGAGPSPRDPRPGVDSPREEWPGLGAPAQPAPPESQHGSPRTRRPAAPCGGTAASSPAWPGGQREGEAQAPRCRLQGRPWFGGGVP